MHLTVSRLQISDPYSWSKFRIRFFHICVYLFIGGHSLIVRGVQLTFGMIRHRNKGVEIFCKHRIKSTDSTKSRWLFKVPGFLFESNPTLLRQYSPTYSLSHIHNYNSPPLSRYFPESSGFG